jgi:hypothetical protein
MMNGNTEDDPSNPLVYDSNGIVRSEKQRRAYYSNHWRRQMSDHLVMWLELRIDYGKEYLKKRTSDS